MRLNIIMRQAFTSHMVVNWNCSRANFMDNPQTVLPITCGSIPALDPFLFSSRTTWFAVIIEAVKENC